MGLKNDIENAMVTETYNTKLTNIADLVGANDSDVKDRMKTLDFGNYVNLMRALRDQDSDTAKEILGFSVEEAYSTGSTLSPGEMRGQKAQSSASAPAADAQTDNATMSKKAAAMQRLGKKNLGGVTGQQAASALDKAEQGKALTPMQRKAMAAQASSVDKLASDPKTAQQFRSLLNKLK
ncbi:hypothetical protein N9E09_00250 [bacterium]|nr:hypothetical protein [bacterium]